MLSLYDYLGRAAGPKLGAQVAIVAKRKNVKVGLREVSNKVYTGTVNLYDRAFLDEYFTARENSSVIEEDREWYVQKLINKHQK